MDDDQGTQDPDAGLPDAGRRLSYWISLILQTEREKAGIRADDLARIMNVSVKTVERLESDKSFDRHIDRYLAGYAFALGLDDARQLWMLALERWRGEGAAPEFRPPEGPAEAFARAIREEARRRVQAPDGRNETPHANRTKRANH